MTHDRLIFIMVIHINRMAVFCVEFHTRDKKANLRK